MRDTFHDFLFSKGYFVGEGAAEHAPEALASLAKLFNIHITSHPDWATVGMVQVASRNLGKDVPAPFYKGFPESVMQLSFDELLIDRLLHYTRTYGLGDFSEAGHSLFEEEVIRKSFDEEVPVREFAIISEKEAATLLRETVESLLQSTRPLSEGRYQLLRDFIDDYNYEVAACNCKDTVVRLLLDTRNTAYARLLKLSDVIRLVEQLQFQDYDSTDIKKLNLKNRDRMLLTGVLDAIFGGGTCDVLTCLEKRKLWKGLLHHLHYKAKNTAATDFLNDIRGTQARSAYSAFEQAMGAGDVHGAMEILRAQKGAGAILRNLDYLLSRCTTDEQIDDVLDNIATSNKIILIQLLEHYGFESPIPLRTFTFQKFNMMRVHAETPDEVAKRRTNLPIETIARACKRIQAELERACKGTLGRVYVDEDMKRIAVPLQLSASMSGVATLPCGSRLPIPAGKKIRAFTYWERVDDIDLSAFALSEDGQQIEFSWRSLLSGEEVMNDSPVMYSGDQTSGYDGGSEYFDIDIEQFKATVPEMRYVVFCDNVFTGTPFANCFCKAGYMMRDEQDSGEVFEPKTVASSFGITCPSTFAYLFAIDLKMREMVWLNMARDSRQRVAGETGMAFLLKDLGVTNIINLYDFAQLLATEVVDDPSRADVVFSDKPEALRYSAERIRSTDVERIVALLN